MTLKNSLCQLFPAPLLERIALALCLLVPWLLIVSRGISDGAGAALAVLFLLHSWQTKNWRWLKNPVIRACALAWLWMLTASLFATDIRESFKVAGPWARWGLLYASLVFWVLVPAKSLRLCALNIAFMLCLVIIDTVWQYHFGVSLTGHVPNANYRLTGPMDNVKVGIFIAKLCFPACAILLYQAMQAKRPRAIWGTLALLVISVATVMLSGERTAFFSCLLALGVLIATLVLAEPTLRAKSLLAAATAIVLSLGLLYTQPVLQQRLAWLSTNIENFKTSSYGELSWVGYQIGSSHPVTGAGLKGFRELCPAYKDSGQVSDCNLHPHNSYVEWFAELGVPGLLAFLLLVAALTRETWRATKANRGAGRIMAALSLGVMAMHFFPLMVTQSFFSNWPALLLWYSISIAIASLNMVKYSQTTTV